MSITGVRTADGALVTVATFLGPVRYVLHNGSADPGPAASGLVRAGPAVTGAERRELLAAFNGGFKWLRQHKNASSTFPNAAAEYASDLIMPLLDAHIPLLAHCHHPPAAAGPDE